MLSRRIDGLRYHHVRMGEVDDHAVGVFRRCKSGWVDGWIYLWFAMHGSTDGGIEAEMDMNVGMTWEITCKSLGGRGGRAASSCNNDLCVMAVASSYG